MKSETKGLTYGAIKEFQADPAIILTNVTNDYINIAATNWSVPFQHPYFSSPVAIAFGDGDSQSFQEINRKFPWTVTPRECLENPPAVKLNCSFLNRIAIIFR
jgi:hypothetical protein